MTLILLEPLVDPCVLATAKLLHQLSGSRLTRHGSITLRNEDCSLN